jgi:hypothetical protein
MPEWAYLVIEVCAGGLLGLILAEITDSYQERRAKKRQYQYWFHERKKQRRKDKEEGG